MLPDHLSQLLTAYLDGEASPRQQEAVQNLLKRAAAARTLLQQLQEDAQRLRNLPRRRPEGDLSAKVVRLIAERRPRPSRRFANRYLAPYPSWMGVAVAASVLVVVGLGSYLYVEAVQQGQGVHVIRPKETPRKPAKQPEAHEAIADVEQPARIPEQGSPPPEVLPAPPTSIAQSEDVPPVRKSPAPRPEAPRPQAPNELATPALKTEGLEVVSPGVALNLALRDLDQAPWRDRFRRELRRETAFRMELFCLANGKVRDRLNAAFKAAGVRLVVEPEAQGRLKNHRLKGDYAVYTDALTADGVAKVLEVLGKMDKQAEAKRRGDGQFDRLFLWPINTGDRKELTALFGFDPLQASVKPKAPLGVDIRKPVAEDTAAHVAQSLAGQGTPRRDSTKVTPPKSPERLALLVPYLPNRSRPPSSKEIKQFLDSRKDRPQGTVQLFLILREVNG